jgi:hypothetical protein
MNRIYGQYMVNIWSIELVKLTPLYQNAKLETEFISLAKPKLAWDNHKRPTSYSFNLGPPRPSFEKYSNIGWMNRIWFI